MTQRRSLIAFCAAIVLLGVLAAPAGAASNWTLRQLPPTTFGESQAFAPGLSGISCPTESLCVAAGSQNTLIVSQAPTGGIGDWRVFHPSPPIGPGKTCVDDPQLLVGSGFETDGQQLGSEGSGDGSRTSGRFEYKPPPVTPRRVKTTLSGRRRAMPRRRS